MNTPSAAAVGPLPGFLIIGAMKAGSTTLHSLLEQHPRLYMCPNKEPGFFSRDERYALGLTHYRSLFSGAQPHQICGESSTCYSRHPHYGDAAGRIAKILPDAKLVYILRHPVDRMFSHYKHRMTERFFERTGPVLGFDDALKDNSEIFDASLYAKQAAEFLKFYPRERLLLLTTDELSQDPVATVLKVHEFLEIEPLPPEDLGLQNSFDARFTTSGGVNEYARFRNTPIGEFAANLLPTPLRNTLRKGGLAAARQIVRMSTSRKFEKKLTDISPETRAKLLRDFEEPNAALEQLLGAPVPSTWSI